MFLIFIPIWGRFPFWLIFFNWVETTNQIRSIFSITNGHVFVEKPPKPGQSTATKAKLHGLEQELRQSHKRATDAEAPGCFQKWWYPQIIHFDRVFHYKPPILGYPYFGKMDGENNGKTYFFNGWFEGTDYFRKHPNILFLWVTAPSSCAIDKTGGFNYFLVFSPWNLGRWSNLTDMMICIFPILAWFFDELEYRFLIVAVWT